MFKKKQTIHNHLFYIYQNYPVTLPTKLRPNEPRRFWLPMKN